MKSNPITFKLIKSNRLIASATFYHEIEADYYTLNESIYGKFSNLIKKLGLGLDPALLSTSPIGTVFSMVEVEPGWKNDKRVYQAIIASLEQIAVENKYKHFGFLSIKADSQLFRSVLVENNYVPKFSSFMVVFDVVWKSMNEYWRSFYKRKRDSLKRERSRNKKLGINIEHTQTFGNDLENISEILNDNYIKYQGTRSKVTTAILPQMEDYLKGNFGLINGLRNNQIIASNLYFKWDDTLSLFKIGQREELSAGTKVLFDVSIYSILELAIENGYKTIYMGTGAYRYKVRRGGRLIPLYMYIKSNSRLVQLFMRFSFPILSKIKYQKHKKMSRLK